jgi:glycosyltransferase involved in cell wall biosynthesis
MSHLGVHATVLIATYNRARLLDDTLQSMARLKARPGRTWEVIIVDNNSIDNTRDVVERHAREFPVPLRYLHEPRQGRSSALNTGIGTASGSVIVMTDDDVCVDEGWLEAACDALLERRASDRSLGYVGGPVEPIWEIPPPSWLDLTRGDLWGTIAIQNHGANECSYEDARKVPLGANMAVHRTLFAEVGGFRADLGRTGGTTVLGQEVPEWLMRARAAGYRGLYLPAMHVRHHVPAARLTREYFRRWWFGKGVSRAALERVQRVTELGIDLRATPHVLDVPRYMFGSAARDIVGWVRARAVGRRTDAFRHAMMLAYFAGYFRARQREPRSLRRDIFASVVSTPGKPSTRAGGRLA